MTKKSFNLMICKLLFLIFIAYPVTIKANPEIVKQAEEDINKANSENEAIDKDILEATNIIMKTDNTISNLTVEVNENMNKISELNEEVAYKQILVERAHSETQRAKEAYESRAEEIYKAGNNSYLEGLLKFRGIDDFIQRFSYITKAINTDKRLVEDCENTESDYNEKLDELEETIEEQENLKCANELKIAELNTYKEQQEKNIQILQDKKTSNTNLIKESQLAIDLSKYNIDYKPNRGGEAPDPVSLALSFVNRTPYVWGGTSPNGFDCSGLVVFCYQNASGIYLPRTSEMQQMVGVPISDAELQRGDLVFYGYPAHHVGIYVGDGLMVNAPYSGRNVSVEPVRIYSDYSGARRVR